VNQDQLSRWQPAQRAGSADRWHRCGSVSADPYCLRPPVDRVRRNRGKRGRPTLQVSVGLAETLGRLRCADGRGYLFTRSENRATHAAAERRAQDEALQAYLDQMSTMLMPHGGQPSLYDERPRTCCAVLG
jgi:hypothetical protein